MDKTISELHTTGDGIKLEIVCERADHEKAILLVWPCTGGAFQMYRTPVSSFIYNNISVIQFNPPGHGRSEGQMNYEKAMQYFKEYIKQTIPASTPLIMTGHSGGAGAVLAGSPEGYCMKKYFLISPVVDARESLLYMYRHNTINEFNMLISANAVDRGKVLEILADSEWMDPAIWKKRNCREILDRSSGPLLIGYFLENLFIKGFNTIDELKKNADKCRILTAVLDNWYPLDSIKKLAEENGIKLSVIEKARDHYFTGAWKEVWPIVLDESISVLNNDKL